VWWPIRPFQVLCVLVAVVLTAAFTLRSGYAEHAGARPVPDKPGLGSAGERLNANTVAIISGNPNATYLTIAYDLSIVLDDGDNFRILPVVGKGGGQNIRDVRFMKGIDLGITQANLLNMYRQSNEIGKIDDQIVYITKLFNEEMHLVVRADSGIAELAQLEGKTVNFSDVGSGTQLSAHDIFRRLGIHVQEVNLGQTDALEQLKSGAIAATVLIAGKPAPAMARLGAADGLRLLGVPFTKELQSDYLPAVLGHDDYPRLIEPGHDIGTVAVSAVLIAYNWPDDSDRYRRIAKFVEVFFPKLAELQKPPRHPKWRETNLAAVLPGWTRFAPAEEWLYHHRAPPPATTAGAAAGDFDRFLAGRRASGASADVTNEAGQDQLFQDFLKWQAREHH
jgi:uncharacterized protein